jgi:hypothetical protein
MDSNFILKILGSERRLIAVARHVSGVVFHPDLVLVGRLLLIP